MPLTPGSHLAHYRLLEPLGAGGMGEVWKALDTSLDREVAVKVLPAALSGDRDRLARFEREARVLASLNHPHIAAVYGLHEAGGRRFLAMEMVPGGDLARRLEQGPLPLDDALQTASQLARGLEAAHETGIVHRDLKPANIALAADGSVKILDFGLAKALAGETDPGAASMSPTLTANATAAGVILGTASYMSPEQAKGRPVDRRADMWAFGCILYEMLAGRQAYGGESISERLAAVLTAEPDLERLPAATPAPVRRLLVRCLRKDPDRRLRDAGDARVVLEDVLTGEAPGAETGAAAAARTAPAGSPLWRLLPWGMALAGALAAVAGFWPGRAGAPDGTDGVARLSVSLPRGESLASILEQSVMALSEDGRTLAMIASGRGDRRIFVRRLEDAEARPLDGTDGASSPFLSPDGQWIGFFADNRLRKIAAQGGPVTDLAEVGVDRGGTWCDDGSIVYAPSVDTGLMRLPAGGVPEPLTHPDEAAGERSHRWPECVTGSRTVLFTVGALDKPGDYDDSPIDWVRIGSGERGRFHDGAASVRHAASGHVFLARAYGLSVAPYADDPPRLLGPAVSLGEAVDGQPTSGTYYFGVSGQGVLAYLPHDPEASLHRLLLLDLEPGAEPAPLPLAPRLYRAPRFAPDGRRVAMAIGIGNTLRSDVWVVDTETTVMTRLTFDDSGDLPVWTRDGQEIVFRGATGRGGAGSGLGISAKSADGSGEISAVVAEGVKDLLAPADFSPDGRLLVLTAAGGAGRIDILTLDLQGDGTARFLEDSPSLEWGADVSPGGRWLAYASDESGQPEVYVRSFPGEGGRWQVSTDRGDFPVWSGDGRFLYFLRNDDSLWRVPVTTSPTFASGKPEEVRKMQVARSNDLSRNYDISPDGKRLVLVQPLLGPEARQHVSILLNWPGELARLTGSPR